MTFKIITADERLAKKNKIKGQIYGPYGIGKTSLLYTLDPASTLCLDLEAGMLSVQDWPGRSIRARTWQDICDLTVWICGPNPALPGHEVFSTAHFDAINEREGKFEDVLPGVETLFIDSTTNASQYCLLWAKTQPESFSEKTGKPDTRGMYGLLGRSLVAWANMLQHCDKNVWLVGGLDETEDDFGRKTQRPMIDGKSADKFPYIFDQIITMAKFTPEEGAPYRAFVTHAVNQWGFPAKDRSGRLDLIEEPHLGKLMEKISGPAKSAAERLTYHTEAPAA
jgi:hypothetical protein